MTSNDFSLASSITCLQQQQNELFRQANRIGVHTELFARYLHEQEWRKTLSALQRLLRLHERYNEKRLETACQRALFYDYYSFDIVNLILQHRLDRLPLSSDTDLFGQLFLDFQD